MLHPIGHRFGMIRKSQILRIALDSGTYHRQTSNKLKVAVNDRARSGKPMRLARQTGCQPVPHRANRTSRIIGMRDDILTGDIADILVEPVRFAIKYKACLEALFRIAEVRGSKEQTEFKWHVESGQAAFAWFCTGQIVNAPPAVPDQSDDLVDANLSAVGILQRTTWSKAALQ
jgi:hypothetical protein